jgi:acyl-CoA synthetase (AMP-forming)/AMP-acid ligase II
VTSWLRLLRNRELTMAGLLDELLPLRANRVVRRDAERGDEPFADLHREVAAMSGFLREEAGVQPGDRVGIGRTNDPRCFRWFLAAIRAGAIAVPLNPLLRLPELQRIVSRCGVSTMVTDGPLFRSSIGRRDALPVARWIQDDAGEMLPGFVRMGPDWLRRPPAPHAVVSPRDTVAIFHTSGTDGVPKGARLSSEALLGGRAMALVTSVLVSHRAVALMALPWAHIMAISAALYGLMAGVSGCFLPRFEVAEVLRTIQRHRVTVVVGVPAMFIRLLNANPPPAALASVRLWVSASDHMPAAWRHRLVRYGALVRGPAGLRLRSIFLNAYGMVELGGIGMFGVDAPFLPGGGELCLPCPRFRVRVAGADGRPVPRGTQGECLVRGPGVGDATWDESAGAGRLVTPDGWLRTGDLAVRNRLGLVRLVGRSKDVIKCGGYTVLPLEVEDALAAHPAVARAAVVGVPHTDNGEEPVAVVECREGFDPTEEDLLDWCRQRLAVYKRPRRIGRVPAGTLPTGVTEKVLRNVLRARLAARDTPAPLTTAAPQVPRP